MRVKPRSRDLRIWKGFILDHETIFDPAKRNPVFGLDPYSKHRVLPGKRMNFD
jgi:hypothetical protein